MDWSDIYKQLAEHLDTAIEFPYLAVDLANDCNTIIVEVDSVNVDNGTDIATFWQRPTYQMYLEVYRHHQNHHRQYMKEYIALMNDYTVKYYNSDLTAFVNGISWTGGCVPYYFAQYSEDGEVDISGWNVCSIS